MKANRKFKDNKELKGGIATWVLMLFGLSVIMYMFGMSSIWTTYSNSAIVTNGSADKANITSSDIIQGKGILDWFANPLNLVVASGIGFGVLTVLAFVFTRSGSVCAYIFIIGMLTVILNLFVFPVSEIKSSAVGLDASGIPFTVMLLGFFNLFYVLTIFEVISGRPT
jgi:hypothetical protein